MGVGIQSCRFLALPLYGGRHPLLSPFLLHALAGRVLRRRVAPAGTSGECIRIIHW